MIYKIKHGNMELKNVKSFETFIVENYQIEESNIVSDISNLVNNLFKGYTHDESLKMASKKIFLIVVRDSNKKDYLINIFLGRSKPAIYISVERENKKGPNEIIKEINKNFTTADELDKILKEEIPFDKLVLYNKIRESNEELLESVDDYEKYIKAVVTGLLKKWPDKFKRYLGIDYNSVEKMIMDIRDEYPLIKNTVGDHYENNTPVKKAIDDLYEPLNRYFQGQASVM